MIKFILNFLNNFYKVKKCKGVKLEYGKLKLCNKLLNNNEYCNEHKIKYRLEKDNCPICLDNIRDNDIPLNIPLTCGHWFHKNCLKPIKNYNCPLCRKRMNKEDIEYIYGGNIEYNNKLCISVIIVVILIIVPILFLMFLYDKIKKLCNFFLEK